MTNNDLFRRLRYILNYDDSQMSDVFALENYRISQTQISDFLKKEEEEGYVEMGDSDMGVFLDGLISQLRGKRESKPGSGVERRLVPRNNNDRLKKLRIAFHLEEAAMLKVFSAGDFTINKGELSAFFRKKDHRNYKPLGDQGFRKFLNGLVTYLKSRPE